MDGPRSGSDTAAGDLVVDFLEHHGVKGMHWGVHKDRGGSSVNRLQFASPAIDPTVTKPMQIAGKEVSARIAKRYNFPITAIKSVHPGDPLWDPESIGFVVNTPGQKRSSGEINVLSHSDKDVGKLLQHAEKLGWYGEGCGNERAFFTHETAHAIFHAEQKVKTGLLRPKISGGNIKARDKALTVAFKQAQKDGIPSHLFAANVSDYAGSGSLREEVEAELFSQYHWSPNPPAFVKVWGETLHEELGIDGTPFRKEAA